MRAAFTVARGRERRLRAALGAARGATGPEPTAGRTRSRARIDDTAEAWRSWEAEHDVYEGPHRELVRLSARVLKGLTYRPTGAIVAAPTTSLPETVGGERNWDYRFSWIRDSSLTLEALYIGACPDEAEDFVSFMTSAGGRPVRARARCRSCTGSAASTTCPSASCEHLRGWRDSRRSASATAPGTRSSSTSTASCSTRCTLYRERLGELHPEIQAFVADLADTAARRWRETDAGMWEMRGEPRHHLSSKVLCWVALDRAVKLAPQLGGHAKTEEWAAERDDPRGDPRPGAGASGGRRTRSRSAPTSSTRRRC